MGGTIPIMTHPDDHSAKVRDAHADEVFAWQREVSAENTDIYIPNQRWVETPKAIFGLPIFSPVKNIPNTPLTALPAVQMVSGPKRPFPTSILLWTIPNQFHPG